MQSDFPPLDCHAHIDPTVTESQVATLKGAQIFAMTRSLDEAAQAQSNRRGGIYWSVGTHPAVPSAVSSWNEDRFKLLAKEAFLVGEVGLDRRGGTDHHGEILQLMLEASRGSLVSVHSAGKVSGVLDRIEKADARGVILHWFLADSDEVSRAVKLGCYFSVNAAMPDDSLRRLPYDRVLPETDFPASRTKTGASKPGDIRTLEAAVTRLTRLSQRTVRENWYRTLDRVIGDAEATDRVPMELARWL